MGGLFGGGGGVSAPPPPAPPPPAPTVDKVAEAEEAKKRRDVMRRSTGRESTILTSGLGVEEGETQKKTLLGG
jgi:hypothetical protein